ncbi:hypothetical protein BC941DRAFT_351442 [Chlamydoabsidia padenii]|nr:hypothetical protein BC941DRAFT_351442 [Chlamydoabsidia padenii]
MRFYSLTEKLESITKDYDYGIVPGSAAVFVKEEVLGIGRLDMTLLENVIVVIDVSNEGYKIASSSPLSDDPTTLAALEHVQACRSCFETMDNLLMTASPLFRDRFQSILYDKLHKAQQLQQTFEHFDTSSSSISTHSSSPMNNPHHDALLTATNNQLQYPASFDTHTSSSQQDIMDEFNQWIH